ncbi:hypothetical protein U1Q18_034483 [Sarracenia purpurea var. burkii]
MSFFGSIDIFFIYLGCPRGRLSLIPFVTNIKEIDNLDDDISLFHECHEMGFKHDYPSYSDLYCQCLVEKKTSSSPPGSYSDGGEEKAILGLGTRHEGDDEGAKIKP